MSVRERRKWRRDTPQHFHAPQEWVVETLDHDGKRLVFGKGAAGERDPGGVRNIKSYSVCSLLLCQAATVR